MEMLKTGSPTMVAESVAFAGAEPPPDTTTLFTKGEVALAVTLNDAVITG